MVPDDGRQSIWCSRRRWTRSSRQSLGLGGGGRGVPKKRVKTHPRTTSFWWILLWMHKSGKMWTLNWLQHVTLSLCSLINFWSDLILCFPRCFWGLSCPQPKSHFLFSCQYSMFPERSELGKCFIQRTTYCSGSLSLAESKFLGMRKKNLIPLRSSHFFHIALISAIISRPWFILMCSFPHFFAL